MVKRLLGWAHGAVSPSARSAIALALPVLPAVEVGGRLGRLALPPDLVGLGVVGDVGEDRAGAGLDRAQRGGVGQLVGVLGDAEDAVLGVDRADPPVVGHPQPRDVVAVELHVVALAHRVGRQRHRQVGLARGAREPAADVVLRAGLLVDDPEQHELLGEELARRPAVVAGLPQAVGDLAQQRVAAVRRPEVQDRALVGHGDEVALVLGGALPEVGQVAGDVHGPDEHLRGLEVVEVGDADAGHPDHVQHDRAVVGQLDAGGVGLQRRAGRRHQVGDDVHRLAARGAAHPLQLAGGHLLGVAPVVVDAPVLGLAGGHDRALLRARGVLEVAARVVETLTRREELPGVEGLRHQAVVVGGVDHLDAVGLGDPGPVGHVLAHVRVLHTCLVEGLLHIAHVSAFRRSARRAALTGGPGGG